MSKGRRRELPLNEILAFVVVAQLYSLTVAMNLFYLVMLLKPAVSFPKPTWDYETRLIFEFLPEFLLKGSLLLAFIPALESYSFQSNHSYLCSIAITWLLILVPQVSLCSASDRLLTPAGTHPAA
jgi:hypothetical protein